MSRSIRRSVVIGLAGVALTGVVFGWWLLATEGGLRFVWPAVERRLPETLVVERVGGSVLGPVQLFGITARTASQRIDVEQVEVQWRATGVVRRRVDIRSIVVDGVRAEIIAPVDAETESPEDDTARPAFRAPIPISVEQFVMRDLRLLTPDAGPFEVDSVSASALSADTTVHVGSLSAVGPRGSIQAGGWLTPSNAWPFHVETTWELPHPELGAIAGSTVVTGTLDSVRVDASTTAPAMVTVQALVRDPTTEPSLLAEVTVEDTDAQDLRPDAPPVSVGGRFELEGWIGALHASGEGHVTAPDIGRTELDLSVRLASDTLYVDASRARARGAMVQASGHVLPGGEDTEADLVLEWTELRWPLDGDAIASSPSGRATISGTRASYDVRLDSRLLSQDRPEIGVVLRGEGTPTTMAIREARLLSSAGGVRARGDVAWGSESRWNLDFAAVDVRPEAFAPDSIPVRGLLQARGRSRGVRTAQAIRSTVVLDSLHGVLNDEPVHARLDGSGRVPFSAAGPSWMEATLALETLELLWGQNHLSATGFIEDTLAITGTASLPDLSVLPAPVSGRMEGYFGLNGPRSAPDLDLDLSASELVTDAVTVDVLAVTGRIETAPDGVVQLSGAARGIRAGEQALDSLTVGVDGSPVLHRFSADVWAAAGSASLEAQGGVTDATWDGVVERLALTVPRWGVWELRDSASMSASSDRARISTACLESAPAVLCASASWQREGFTTLDATLQDFEGDRLIGPDHAGWSLSGRASGTLSAELAPDRSLVASADLGLSEGQLGYPSRTGVQAAQHRDTELVLEVDGDGARTDFRSVVTEAGGGAANLLGELDFPGFQPLIDSIPSQAVQGSVRASVVNLGALDALLQDVDSIGGDLSVDVTVSGTIGQPGLVGDARFTGGHANIPPLGLQLREIELTAQGRGLDGVEVTGRLRSGTGVLNVSGALPTIPSEDDPAVLRLTGTRIAAVDLPEVEVWVSPDLELTLTPDAIRVGGGVGVPVARVELSEIPASAVRPSRDVVFVDDTSSVAQRARTVRLNVRTTLGDSVSFQGFGFSARPRGSVLATDGPGRTTIGTGEVILEDGRYRAYGQDLTIERGRVLFAAGPIENPGLDIRASRTADDGVVAGLEVRGTLRQPIVTLFSEPAMTESEALAYIVLGRPLGSANTAEGSRVADAAIGLGLREGNALASRIAGRFGLSEVRVEADGPLEEASLIAGAYLSPRLYVSYGVGLFEPISTFRLRYLLSSRWTLRAESGASSSADMLFRLERGR